MNIKKIIYSKSWHVYLLGLIIVIIRLFPFYFAFINSGVLITYNIGRFIILLLFIYLTIKRKLFSLKKGLLIILFLYFFSSSVSIITTENLSSFFTIYKDLISAFLLFFVTFSIVNKNNIYFFIKVLVTTFIINLTFETFVYFFHSMARAYIFPFLYDKYIKSFEFQADRGRFFGDSFDEVLIPFVFIFIIQNKQLIKKAISILYLFVMVFIITISSWRTKALIFISAMTISILIYLPKIKQYIAIFVIFILLSIFVTNRLSLTITGFNIYDRLLLEDSGNSTIVSRLYYWKEAVEIGLSSPITGVGLGNFYDYLSNKSKAGRLRAVSIKNIKPLVIDDPHNVFFSTFANTGFLGLISFTILILYFLITDLQTLSKQNLYLKGTLIAFWSLFIFSLLNPAMYYSYLLLFWFLRGMIEKLKTTLLRYE